MQDLASDRIAATVIIPRSKEVKTGSSSPRQIATVKWCDNDKIYGLLLNKNGEDIFVHYRSILANGYKTLKEGQSVEFIQVQSAKGWQAAEVVVIGD